MLDDASSVYYLGMVLVCEGLILLLSTHVFREHVLPFADRVMAAETIEKDAKALIGAYPSFRTPHAFENDGVALQELRRARNMAIGRFIASSGGAVLLPFLPGLLLFG